MSYIVLLILIIIKNAETTLKTSLNKKEDGKLFISAYRAYYENEHELIELAKHSKEVSSLIESFNIAQLLRFTMELYTYQAIENNITLELYIEPCFPKEVSGERIKFELMIDYILKHFIEHNSNNTIRLSAHLNEIFDDIFILTFVFKCNENDSIKEENLKYIFKNRTEYCMENTSLGALHFVEFINILKGGLKVSKDENKLSLKVEFPFNVNDSSKPIAKIPLIEIFPKVNIDKCTIKWLKEIENKPLPSIPLTPELYRPTTKKLSSQMVMPCSRAKALDEIKQKLIERVRKGSETKANPSRTMYNKGMNNIDISKIPSLNIIKNPLGSGNLFTDNTKKNIANERIDALLENSSYDCNNTDRPNIICDMHIGEKLVLLNASREKKFYHCGGKNRSFTPTATPKRAGDSTGYQTALNSGRKADLIQHNDRILLVECEESGFESIKSALEKKKMNYDTTENLSDTLVLYKNDKYLAVFIDIDLPNEDGYEIAKRIRKIQSENKSKQPTFICGFISSDDEGNH